MTDLAAGRFSDEPIFAKHLLCVSIKAGYQDKDGNIQVEQNKHILADAVGEEKADEVIKKCVKQYDTPEQTALEVTKCLRENVPMV